MAIEYLEIRDINRELIGIIDTAKSVIWHTVYFGTGDFEIYAKATPEHIELLKAGRYVTRIDNVELGIIEKIVVNDSIQDGTMITATGRFAKSLLDRRLIYNMSDKINSPSVLRGNVEAAVRKLVYDNAIRCTFDSRRNMSVLDLGSLSNIPYIIVDDKGNASEKQVSHENLLEYTNSLLQEYGLTSVIYLNLDTDAKRLNFRVENGIDRSVDNTLGLEPVVFGKDYDNLSASEYSYNTQTEKNTILIGGEGEGVDRFYSLIASAKIGLDRRETWLDTSSTNKTLKQSVLQELYPTGTFVGTTFVVNGTVYADLVVDLEHKYSLNSLQSKFPTGTVSGTKFIVNNVTYATQIYGEENEYNLTPLGYKAMLDVDEKEGNYLLTDTLYKSMLDAQGKQMLAPQVATETFDGTINVTAGNYVLNQDFWIGDIVTVEEKSINKYINVRIAEVTEIQDENGYTVEAKYQ